jgi:cytochrome b involved in lipid metabolism
MKKLTALSLFIFWTVVTAILTSGLIFYQNGKSSVTVPAMTGTQTQTLTAQELAKHNSATSCWLLIDGKVYDVTSYLYQHPGNADTILPTCGTDATQAYATKGRTSSPSPHSQNAHELLKAYYIGDFGKAPATATAPVATTPETQPAPVAQPKPTTTGTPATNATVTLSSREIATHNTTSNCWLIISGSVYNVTSYLGQHPGGVSAIRPYCGKDGSAAFQGLPHSTNAHQLLANFLVGAVGQKATTQTIQNTASPTLPAGMQRGEIEND